MSITGAATRSTITDASGRFAFSGLTAGMYVLSPTQAGYVFNPTELAVRVAATDLFVNDFSRVAPSEGLGTALMARIDSAPVWMLPEASVILPNGQNLSAYAQARGLKPATLRTSVAPDWLQPVPLRAMIDLPPAEGPQQRKNDIVTMMLLTARDYACARLAPGCTKWDFPAQLADPVGMPAQSGLTYVYGGKTPEVRTKPVDGCPERTYGMDCSGYIYKLATSVGAILPVGTASLQQKPESWEFPAYWKLRMAVVNDGSLETGDIVGTPDHIGIIQTSGSIATANFLSSVGNTGECRKNISAPRGPSPRSLGVFPGPYTTLRLVTTLSGVFDLYIRCTAQSTDAAVIRFNINNDRGGAFQATGAGFDYDGDPLCFKFSGTYDQVGNVLTATLSLCDGTRSDSFATKLLNDDTGYFQATKVVDNRACTIAVRLKRVTDATQERKQSIQTNADRTPKGYELIRRVRPRDP